ncbi:hypothetical protein AGLY_008607 [Aphis glycines]|uniref:Uncharacterized protein n=1 Tax=Aphis glycines TaxID=307491 RepID=A0A6G0TLC4_APHGL|nr:hypothetical protein AGLY_008607 [Aphis glycines]
MNIYLIFQINFKYYMWLWLKYICKTGGKIFFFKCMYALCTIIEFDSKLRFKNNYFNVWNDLYVTVMFHLLPITLYLPSLIIFDVLALKRGFFLEQLENCVIITRKIIFAYSHHSAKTTIVKHNSLKCMKVINKNNFVGSTCIFITSIRINVSHHVGLILISDNINLILFFS